MPNFHGAGSKVVCTSEQPGLAPKLSQDVARALHGRAGTPALAFYDRRTSTTCDFRSGTAFDSASVVKVTVLGALLRQAEEAHRKLTPLETRRATAMITKSDNAATAALWHEIGPAGIKRFLELAGMRHTVPDAGKTWGLTQITAGDQAALMRLLTEEGSRAGAVLSPAARAYALDLMKRVVPAQRWGVPAGAPAPDAAYVKNGWLPRESKGSRVHSVGAFTGGGHDDGMAVLSHGNHCMAYGVGTVEAATGVIHRHLRAVASGD